MREVRTEISETLINDLIIEFLSKTALENESISDVKVHWHEPRHKVGDQDLYTLTYLVNKEVKDH